MSKGWMSVCRQQTRAHVGRHVGSWAKMPVGKNDEMQGAFVIKICLV